jgi:Kef-type K+ transport system membrane component KefB
MGAYTAFLDIALGFGTPGLGLLADHAGLSSAFAASMLAALGSVGIVARLLRKRQASRERQECADMVCADMFGKPASAAP